ncbi:hypothetical protein QJQ45_021733 [Haematococcus lacustris]|nr:hypothetical protein QJQ45_021733 [Haematococcus lacustris]
MEGEAVFDPNVNTQPYRGATVQPTVAELHAKLLRSKTLRKDRYTLVINASEKAVKLVCLLCGLQLSLRLLSVHVSTCASERNWSAWGRLYADALRSCMDMATAEKLIFIQTNDEVAANYDNIDKSNQQDVAIKLF